MFSFASSRVTDCHIWKILMHIFSNRRISYISTNFQAYLAHFTSNSLSYPELSFFKLNFIKKYDISRYADKAYKKLCVSTDIDLNWTSVHYICNFLQTCYALFEKKGFCICPGITLFSCSNWYAIHLCVFTTAIF